MLTARVEGLEAVAFAIVPSNNLLAAVPFWETPGLRSHRGDANYIIMTGWRCEVHLTQAAPEVDAIAARVDDLIIRPGGVLGHREWGLYEVGVCGPDVCLSASAGHPAS
jgi:hypothetical protein